MMTRKHTTRPGTASPGTTTAIKVARVRKGAPPAGSKPMGKRSGAETVADDAADARDLEGRTWDQEVCRTLIDELWAIREGMLQHERALASVLRNVSPDYHASARNLAHYLVLRQDDRRPLQERLAWIGVSSLGSSESHVLANLDKVLGILHRLTGQAWEERSHEEPAGIRSSREAPRRPHRRPVGRPAAGTCCPHHGDASLGSCNRLRSRASARRFGHGHCANQLRPRRCGGLGGDDEARSSRCQGGRPPRPDFDGPRRAEVAHRRDTARTGGSQAEAKAQRSGTLDRTRPGWAATVRLARAGCGRGDPDRGRGRVARPSRVGRYAERCRCPRRGAQFAGCRAASQRRPGRMRADCLFRAGDSARTLQAGQGPEFHRRGRPAAQGREHHPASR